MRQNLASDLADTLRDIVADGRLVGGERVNEGDLARALEVSRTPLREALCRLQGEGFVDAQPRLGFFVRTLDEGATRNLYQMRSVLEPTALELAGIPSAQGLRRLRRLDDDLSNARAEVETVIELDGAWHLELTSG